MPFQIIRADITTLQVDAIVNPTNTSLIGYGGVNGAILKSAGPSFIKECQALNGCEIGQAKISKVNHMPCHYIIHTVGPQYTDGNTIEIELLKSCYYSCLELALKYNLNSIAFPLISSGTFKFPKDLALLIANTCISEFLNQHDLMIYLAVYDNESYLISKSLYSNIQSYIDDCQYIPARNRDVFTLNTASLCDYSLDDYLSYTDESFSEMLLRLIDEKGMTDAECYKRANKDRKLFSKIRSQKGYKPSKQTAIAFAIALELDLDTAKELLSKAGYALSHSFKADIIIEYFIIHKNYDILSINEALFSFDQPLI